MLPPGEHIDVLRHVALETLLELFKDPEALRRAALEQLRWLTFDDVKTITGFGDTKLKSLHKKGIIPFFRAPESNELRITRAAWQQTETRLIREGLLPRNRYQPRI